MRTMFGTVVAAALAAGCASDGTAGHTPAGHPHHDQVDGPWAGVTEAVCQVHGLGKDRRIRGFVVFTDAPGGVRIVAEIDGLDSNAQHAFHIHEFGDVSSPDGKTAGGHYNPEGHKHGGPDGGPHHAGDLGNLSTNERGRARYDRVVEGISVAGGRNPVVGRSIIIHAKVDDLATDPAGNAGDRIAGGVIGVAKPGEKRGLPEGKKAK